MKAIIIAGLIIDVIGAVLVFLNSPEFFYKTVIYNREELKILERKAKRKRITAKIGFLLILIGFILQLIGTILPS